MNFWDYISFDLHNKDAYLPNSRRLSCFLILNFLIIRVLYLYFLFRVYHTVIIPADRFLKFKILTNFFGKVAI
jgi:hypothetical protein